VRLVPELGEHVPRDALGRVEVAGVAGAFVEPYEGEAERGVVGEVELRAARIVRGHGLVRHATSFEHVGA
jgi:hypothetical protein